MFYFVNTCKLECFEQIINFSGVILMYFWSIERDREINLLQLFQNRLDLVYTELNAFVSVSHGNAETSGISLRSCMSAYTVRVHLRAMRSNENTIHSLITFRTGRH